MKTTSLTLPSNEKLGLLSNLSTMVNAGLTMSEAIDSLVTDANGNLKILLLGIQADINQGKPLYSALLKYPQIFDSVTVTIIKAAKSQEP